MAFKIGEMFWEIKADTKDFDRDAKKTEKTANKLAGTFTSAGKLITAGFSVAIVAGIADISKELINAASDAEETSNKFNVVFRDVAEDAQAAATSLKENFGLSSVAAQTLLSDTGDLLTGFGFTGEAALQLSTDVNELAVDLASFTNFSGGAQGASEALTKALLGERESAKALGISILEADVQAKVLELTQQGLTFETERQAKAFATLRIAQEQSTNAIGDFARSSDSYANRVRIAEAATEDLKTALGESLLPVATSGITVIGNLAGSLADYVEEANAAKEASDNIFGAKTGPGADAIKAAEDLRARLDEVRAAADNYANGIRGSRGELLKLARQYDFNIKRVDEYINAEEKYLEAIERNAAVQAARNEEEREQQQALADEAKAEADRLAAIQDYISYIEGEYSETNQAKLEELEREIELIENNIDGYGGLREEQLLLLELKREEAEALRESLEAREEETEAVQANYAAQYDAYVEYTDALRAIAAEERVREEEQRAFEAETLRLRTQAYANFYGSVAQLLDSFGAQSAAVAVGIKAFSAAEAAINSYLAFTQVLADPSFVGRPIARGVTAAAILTSGLAQQIKILSTPIPAFQDGGIVPGTSFSGDNVPARVNSGEMILNAAQQAQLFDMANGVPGGAGYTVVLQLPNGREFGKWTVDTINSGQGGVIQGRVVK